MALSTFSERFAAFDVTPVENLFLLEYMPHAPGDYVRVYLYGLMQCHHPDADATIEGMARVLRLETQRVLEAFRYWEQKGLVIGVSDSPPRFEYENVRSAMAAGLSTQQDGAYQYRDLVNELQGILGLLHPQQLSKAMEWVEDLKLPQDVVLCLVREKHNQLTDGGKKKRSLPYLFKAFDACALDFAQRGIKTGEAAQRELARGNPDYKLASKVLDYFNIRRAPTTAEVQLAEKWIHEWKLDERAVTAGLKQTAGSSNPSFAYLDRILARHQGQADGDVEAGIERSNARFAIARTLLGELMGSSGHAPTEDVCTQVQAWLDQGFEPEALTRAAVRCNRSGRRSFDQLSLEVERWAALGITTAEKAEEHNRQLAALRTLAASVFDRAGIERTPTESDLNQLRGWTTHAPTELVLHAADCAKGLKLPLRAMAKNLDVWAQKGIMDVEAATVERRERNQRPPKANGKPETKAAPYAQRSYEGGYFDDFFANLDEGSGDD